MLGKQGLKAEGDTFTLDGEPFRILSGSFHYYRTHPDQWKDRLMRIKAAGLNTSENLKNLINKLMIVVNTEYGIMIIFLLSTAKQGDNVLHSVRLSVRTLRPEPFDL